MTNLRRILWGGLVMMALFMGLAACSGCEDEFDDAGLDVGLDADSDTDDADGVDGQDTGDTGHDDDRDATDGGDAGDDSEDLDATDGGAIDVGDEEVGADTGSADAGDTSDTDDADAGTGADTGGETPPDGLSEPCENGSGWTLFRFSYSSLSTSASIDVWDASCTYSFAPGSACNVQEVTTGFGDINTTSDGYPIVTGSDYIRVRYSVDGLAFSEAHIHLQARSYSSVSTTDYRIWSPLYGDNTGGPVSQAFSYDWYYLDWTGYLYPTDDPNLTAIQIYADGGSNQLAVQSVELCVE